MSSEAQGTPHALRQNELSLKYKPQSLQHMGEQADYFQQQGVSRQQRLDVWSFRLNKDLSLPTLTDLPHIFLQMPRCSDTNPD